MKKIKYIRYLDYLRVFLAIFVIQVHLTMNNSLLNSWFFDPVLLFFAISGYSNFMSWKQKESIWKFYKKRLWTLVLSGIIVGFIIDITYIPFHLSKLNNLSLDTFATTSFLKVFVFEPLITLFPYFHNIIGGDIQFLETWEALSVDMSSPVVWSLKMELLFYLIFPFIMKFYFHFKNWKKI